MHIAFSGTASDVRRADAEEYKLVELTALDVNIGEAYDNDTSTFTSPIDGLYLFTFVAIANGNGAAPLVLFRNEVQVAQSGRTSILATGPFPLGSNHVYISLKKWDQVALKTTPSGEGLWSGIMQQFSSRTDVTFAGHLVAAL